MPRAKSVVAPKAAATAPAPSRTASAVIPNTPRTQHPLPVKRTDFLFIYDVSNGNPNGDPDAGNAPRQNPETGQGIVTDVAIKRKLRDLVQTFHQGETGMEVFVAEGAVLGELKAETMATCGDTPEARKQAMCERFWDVRTFGGVLRANKAKDAQAPNVNGPIQIEFGKSVDPILVSELSITRCAAENERENKENKTFGAKPVVHYALYTQAGHINPYAALKSHMTQDDLDVFKRMSSVLFEHDRAAGRASMCMRMIVAFEHDDPLGTPGCNGSELLDAVKVRRNTDGPAARFEDYEIILPQNLPDGVTLSIWKAPFIASYAAAA